MGRGAKPGSENPHWRIIDNAQLTELYMTQKLSLSATARLLGTSRRLVRCHLKHLGISSRTYEEQTRIELETGRNVEAHACQIVPGSRKRNRKEYLALAKALMDWKCQTCGRRQTNDHFDLVVHHEDGDNHNNTPDNLRVLCQSCHAKLQRKKS